MANRPVHCVLVVLLLICCCVEFSQEQSELVSPCPELFQYRYDGSEWYGVTELQSPPLGQTIKLNILLSLRAQLPTSYVGVLELFGTREAAIQDIRQRRPVRYRIRFPVQSPIPKLTQILYNGRVICSGSPETGTFVTAIRLEHTLYTELANQLYPNGNPSEPEDTYSSFGGDTVSNNNNFNNNNNNNIYEQYPQYQPESVEIIQIPTEPPYRPPTDPPYRPRPQATQRPIVQQQRPVVQQQRPVVQQQPSYIQGQAAPTNAPVIPIPSFSAPSAPNVDELDDSQVQCGRPHDRFKISPLVVGGQTIQRGAWPWLVAVYINKATGLSFNCGGNLVSNKVVVTAAHCFRSTEKTFQASEVVIFLGRYNIMKWMEQGSQFSEVESINVHTDYMKADMSYDADVAVVVMKTTVKYTEYIRPICLWEGSDSVNDIVGSSGTVVGWGRDGTGNIVTPEPKKIQIPVVSEAVCLRSSDTYRYITSKRTFCAGKRDGYGPCNGDSGSGMAIFKDNRIMLRGIVSAALADPVMNTCNLGEYVVFTDAAKFTSWIRSFM